MVPIPKVKCPMVKKKMGYKVVIANIPMPVGPSVLATITPQMSVAMEDIASAKKVPMLRLAKLTS